MVFYDFQIIRKSDMAKIGFKMPFYPLF